MNLNNIFGTCADSLVNGPVFSARFAALPNRYTRIQADWSLINPSAGVFVWTNFNNGCDDAIIANAAAQGRTILFDVVNWPDWVIADWANRFQHASDYVTAVLTHWTPIALIGCWNEPTQVATGNASLFQPPNPNATNLQLMTEYHNLVVAIYNAAKSVNPKVGLNVGKFGNFENYLPMFAALKSLGTWAMAALITWHDYYDANFDPMIDTPATATQPFTRSVAHKCQFMQATFPGVNFGSDEYYWWTLPRTEQAAVAFLANGASILCPMLLPWPPPGAATNPYYLNCYGVDANGNLNAIALAFIAALTMPPDAIQPAWAALQAAQ